MKQKITLEQFAELSKPAGDQLVSWALSKQYSPLLSIGQMIEFLDEHGKMFNIRKRSPFHGNGVELLIGTPPTVLTERALEEAIKKLENQELCDALWEAIKPILNHEEKGE